MVSKIPILIAGSFAIIFFAPLVVLFVTGTDPRAVLTSFSNPNNVDALWTTLYPSALGTALSTVFGITFAWVVYRTNVPGRKILAILPLMELCLPQEVKAIGFEFLLHPSVGLYNILFKGLFHVNYPIFNINSNAGIALALAAGGMPFAYLVIMASMKGMDSSLEESSRVTGSSLWNTLRRVTLPMISPAIVTVLAVGFVVGASIFDYAFIFGTQASSGVNTLATAVYDNVTEMTPPNYSAGAALSLYYIILTLGTMSVWLWYTRRSHRFVTIGGARSPPSLYILHGWKKWAAFTVCILFLWVSFLQLLFILVLVSLYPLFTTLNTLSALQTASLANYAKLFFSAKYALFWPAFENSLIISTLTGGLAAFLALFISYGALKSKIRGTRLLEYFNTLPIGTPGIVWSLSFLWLFLSIPLFAKYLYGTDWALMMALVVVWLPFAVRIMAGPMLQLSNDMEESASVAGAKWMRIYRTVLVPLLKSGIMVSFVYVFIDSFRELGDVILLVTPNSYVLTTFIADLYRNTALSSGVQAATGVVMIMSMFAFLLGINFLMGGTLLSAVGEQEANLAAAPPQ